MSLGITEHLISCTCHQLHTRSSLTGVRHEIFAGVYFCRLVIFCVVWELIFAIRKDWFFLLGINFCDFQKVPGTGSIDNISVVIEYAQ